MSAWILHLNSLKSSLCKWLLRAGQEASVFAECVWGWCVLMPATRSVGKQAKGLFA